MALIPFALLSERAYPPTVNHEHDAGMDFYCQWYTSIDAHQQKVIRTGVLLEIPKGYVGLLKPKGAQMQLIGSGVVEWTYQGEIMFRVINATKYEKIIHRGDPIGQMILVRNMSPFLAEVDLDTIHMDKTERGATGGILLASSQQE